MNFETISSFEKFRVNDTKRITGGGDKATKYKSGTRGGQSDTLHDDGTVTNEDGSKGVVIK